jgi:hypothetical protein
MANKNSAVEAKLFLFHRRISKNSLKQTDRYGERISKSCAGVLRALPHGRS